MARVFGLNKINEIVATAEPLPPLAAKKDRDLHRRLAFYPLTDLGNAERFRDRFRGKLIFCPALGSQKKAGWLHWDDKRWARDGADERVKIAEHETIRAIQDEAEAIAGTKDDFVLRVKNNGDSLLFSEAIAQHGRASESLSRLGALSKRAAPYLFVLPSQLDADRYAINVANGTLRIRKTDDGTDYVKFSPHDSADLITKISPVKYDAEARAPNYEAFLAMVQPKGEIRRFLHQWLGYSLTGDTSEQLLTFNWGKGKNGKSTLFNIVAYIAGDYGSSITIETFLQQGQHTRQGGQATPDLASLQGVRFLRTSEPERNAKLGEALIKLATGGEPMYVRHLNNDFFELFPQFKLTISGNYKPVIHGTDEGIWRRMALIPWTVEVPQEKRIKDFDHTLRPEAPGILNLLLDGLRDWRDNGLVLPSDVQVATSEYRRDSDPLGRFLDACVGHKPGMRTQSSVLYETFRAWAKANGANEWSNKAMSAALRERGYMSKHSDVMWWLDVELLKQPSDFVDSQGHVREAASWQP